MEYICVIIRCKKFGLYKQFLLITKVTVVDGRKKTLLPHYFSLTHIIFLLTHPVHFFIHKGKGSELAMGILVLCSIPRRKSETTYGVGSFFQSLMEKMVDP